MIPPTERPLVPRRIETARLILRPWEPDDLPGLHEAVTSSHDHLYPWLPWMAAEPIGMDQRRALLDTWTQRWENKEDFTMGIFDKRTGRVLGGTGLHHRGRPYCVEIGYWLRIDATGHGYVTEASEALVHVALAEQGYPRLEIRCDPNNVSSAAVPKRLGFTLEGTLRDSYLNTTGSLSDTMVWALLGREYAEWCKHGYGRSNGSKG